MYTAAQYRTAEQDYAERGKLAESDSQQRSAAEINVRCESCERRAFYAPADVHTPEK